MTARLRPSLADRLEDALVQGSVGWLEPFADPQRHSREETQAAWRTVERRWSQRPSSDGGPLMAWAKTVGALTLLREPALTVLPRLLHAVEPSRHDACAALRHLSTVPGAAHAMRALLVYGVPADGDERGVHTPLMAAAARGLETHVSLLLTHGANPTRCDTLGWSAADWAGEAGEAQTLLLLSEAGAEAFAVRQDGLHAVARLYRHRAVGKGLRTRLLALDLGHRLSHARHPLSPDD